MEGEWLKEAGVGSSANVDERQCSSDNQTSRPERLKQTSRGRSSRVKATASTGEARL